MLLREGLGSSGGGVLVCGGAEAALLNLCLSVRLVWKRFLPGTHCYRPGSFGGV